MAAAALQITSPFVITARAADNVKIGLDNPLTGTFAAVGKNELIRAQLAVEQMNAKGGILGRQVELLVEDSTSGEAAVAVQKANKLIERDKVDFLLGNITRRWRRRWPTSASKRRCSISFPAAIPRSVTVRNATGKVFRVCNTTRMETNSVSSLLLKSYGKKWYFITTDYAFGRKPAGGLRSKSQGGGRH